MEIKADIKIRKTCPVCKKKVYINAMQNGDILLPDGYTIKLPLVCKTHYQPKNK